MSDTLSFDPIWNQIYGEERQLNRYPWDRVVSFVYRHYPREKPRAAVSILEVGCGAGSNLWFAAREGFSVAGIDGSPRAVAYARDRLAAEGLAGDLRVGDFTRLPFAGSTFDLVVDRAALTCAGWSAARQAVAEIHRVLVAGGKLLFTPYSDRHSSFAAGRPAPDGLTVDIADGSLQGVGQICFYGRGHLDDVFQHGRRMLSVQHVETIEQREPRYLVHAEWCVIAEKLAEAS